MLNEELIIAQIQLDFESTLKYLGQPTWFWPPEGAVSSRLLSIIYKMYPNIIVVIPDVSLGKRNYSRLIRVEHENNELQKVLVCNSLLKDVAMNSMCYPTNPHKELNMDWVEVKNIYFDSNKFMQMLTELGGNTHVLARDWENMASREGLSTLSSDEKEIKGMIDLDIHFNLPTDGNWQNTDILQLSKIGSGSWEVEANLEDPFIYWWPDEYQTHWQTLSDEQKKWSKKWQTFLTNFNKDFKEWCDNNGGIENLLNQDETKKEIKSLMPALLSCIPWHFLVKQIWNPTPSFSKEAWEKLVIPAQYKIKKMLNTQ